MIDRRHADENDAADLPTIHRFAVMLIPTEEFFRWARSCFDDDEETTCEDAQPVPTAYLIPEDDGDMKNLLRRHYKPMLIEELTGWCTDEASWPEDLSFRTFCAFFDDHSTSMVFDLGVEPLERDS